MHSRAHDRRWSMRDYLRLSRRDNRISSFRLCRWKELAKQTVRFSRLRTILGNCLQRARVLVPGDSSSFLPCCVSFVWSFLFDYTFWRYQATISGCRYLWFEFLSFLLRICLILLILTHILTHFYTFWHYQGSISLYLYSISMAGCASQNICIFLLREKISKNWNIFHNTQYFIVLMIYLLTSKFLYPQSWCVQSAEQVYNLTSFILEVCKTMYPSCLTID